MRGLKRFVVLPRADQFLLLRAMFVVATIRIGLWLLPFRVMRSFVLKKAAKPGEVMPLNQLLWAVKSVSRYLPGSTCLTQALAAQVLLAQSGYQSMVEIGVAKSAQCFEAHAWLVCGNQVVLGGPSVDRYTSLLAWPEKQGLIEVRSGDAAP
jgi:Transglutaminase-like superfamily